MCHRCWLSCCRSTGPRTRDSGPDALVFPTSAGKRDNPSNVRNRFLADSVERRTSSWPGRGRSPIGKVTPPSLRRTFAPLLLATGADVPYVMAQLGHTDPKMTLGVYAKMIASKTDHGAALDGLIGAADWAPIGSMATEEAVGALNVPANRCLSAKSREFPD